MFKHRKHLFIPKKTLYKKLILICSIFLIVCGGCFLIHTYLNNTINIFLQNQQKKIQEQNLNFTFNSISSTSWIRWPKVTLTYPKIQKDISSIPRTIWQTQQATISYSLWHPLNLFVQIDGEQLYCPTNSLNNCFQTHGSPWNIYMPLIGKYNKNSFFFTIKDFFYQQQSQSIWDIQSFKLTDIQGNLHWNSKAQSKDSFIFSDISIEKTFINFATLPTQRIQKLQLQFALIKEQDANNLPAHIYKLLLQATNFSWNNLSINSSGKLYLSYPKLAPTGEISLHLNGINQSFYQQLVSLNCCDRLKQELSQISLPSQLNFTILIRDGVIYLGAIPLRSVWYDDLKILFHYYYTK